jgi:hypothetical protein
MLQLQPQPQPMLLTYRPESSPYHLKGWFTCTSAINFFLNKTETGTLPCYICNSATSFDNIAYTRTIPKISVPVELRHGVSNVFVICNKCADSRIYIQAPKNYAMVLHHIAMKNKGIVDESTELAIITARKTDLERTKDRILEQNQMLQREISEIMEDSTRLERNRDMEIEKAKSLKVYEEQSLDLITLINQRITKMRNKVKDMYIDCAKEIADTHGIINSNYNTLMSTITKEQDKLSDMATLDVTSEHACNICCMRQVQKALIPCGHLVCEVCYFKLTNELESQTKLHCPFCKSKCENTLRIFV